MCAAPGSSLPMLPVFAAMIAGNFWQLEGTVQYCALHNYRAQRYYNTLHSWFWPVTPDKSKVKTGSSKDDSGEV